VKGARLEIKMARKNRDSFGKKKKKRGEERAVRASGWDEMEN